MIEGEFPAGLVDQRWSAWMETTNRPEGRQYVPLQPLKKPKRHPSLTSEHALYLMLNDSRVHNGIYWQFVLKGVHKTAMLAIASTPPSEESWQRTVVVPYTVHPVCRQCRMNQAESTRESGQAMTFFLTSAAAVCLPLLGKAPRFLTKSSQANHPYKSRQQGLTR
jgi:hypothetical protein